MLANSYDSLQQLKTQNVFVIDYSVNFHMAKDKLCHYSSPQDNVY